MARYRTFSHNDQTLRILTRLERRSAELRRAQSHLRIARRPHQHNGPCAGASIERPCHRRSPIRQLSLARARAFPGTEAQVAALADDIAFDDHGIDDGCAPGCSRSPTWPMCRSVGPVFTGWRHAVQGLEEPRLIHESIRR